MRDNPEGVIIPTVNDYRHCKKNNLPFYPGKIRGQKKAVTMATKAGQRESSSSQWRN